MRFPAEQRHWISEEPFDESVRRIERYLVENFTTPLGWCGALH